MTLLLLTLILSYQETEQPQDIWAQITMAETRVTEQVKQADSQFAISATNPCRGYYVAGKGVFLVVPLRYRALSAWQAGKTKKGESGNTETVKQEASKPLTREEFSKRLSQWEERKRAYEITREANFQKVISQVRAALPELMGMLNLAPDDGLFLAIEEAPPAYYYANFSLKRKATRRVVTLTMDSALVQQAKTKGIVQADWLSRVKATTVHRALAASP